MGSYQRIKTCRTCHEIASEFYHLYNSFLIMKTRRNSHLEQNRSHYPGFCGPIFFFYVKHLQPLKT